MYERMLEQTNWYFSWKEYTIHIIMFFGDIYLLFLVCSISTEGYTGVIIEQDTQQAVPCDTYFDSNKNPLITVLCVLAQLMIFVHTQHACYILVQWKWCRFLSLYSIAPGCEPFWNLFHSELKACFKFAIVCRSEKFVILKHVSDWYYANFVISRADNNVFLRLRSLFVETDWVCHVWLNF